MNKWQKELKNVRCKLEPVELFGEMLSEMMDRAEIAGNDLSEKIHVSESAVSNWRHGSRLPDSNMLYPLSQALELNAIETLSLINAYRGNQALTMICGYIKGIEQSLQRKDSSLSDAEKDLEAQRAKDIVKTLIGPFDDNA